jgi:polyhydroxyalkanoate synthesis repressor PhaR
MSNPRVIKKYPNRRLYDTEESRYITLADVKELVMKQVDFEVIDKKSGEDITRTILLQVISDQEQQGDPMMSEDFLSQIIRAYGSVVPDFVTKYLEQSMTLFMQQQKYFKDQLQSVVGTDPLSAMAELTQQNFLKMQSLQEDLLKKFMPNLEDGDAPDTEATDNQIHYCNGDLLPRPLLHCLKEFPLHGGPPAIAGGHFFGLESDSPTAPK